MKKVLIIRSASLQQLDKNIPEITAFFEDAEFHLLTHPHNIPHCRKYKDVSKIIAYDTAAGYSFRYIPPELKKEKYDAVVVLVTNITGAGFLNVFLVGSRIKNADVYICNLRSELRKLPKYKIALMLARNVVLTPLVILLTLPFSLIGLTWLGISSLFSASGGAYAGSARGRLPLDPR